MTMKSNTTPSVEEVLRDYAAASQEFDASVLNDFLQRYPEYSERLAAFASVWLMSARATAEEIQAEEVPVADMLSLQSKVLALLQQVKQQAPAGTDPAMAWNQFGAMQGKRHPAEARSTIEAAPLQSPVFEVIEALRRTTTDESRSCLRLWLESLLARAGAPDFAPGQAAFGRLICVTDPMHSAKRAATPVKHVNLFVSENERVEIQWDEVRGSVDISPMRRERSPLMLCVVNADIGEPVELIDEAGHSTRMLFITDRGITAHGVKFKNPVFVLFGGQ